VKEPSPRRLKKNVAKCLRLKTHSRSPGDGRKQGLIPALVLIWALSMGTLLRRATFAAIEAVGCSRARRALDVSQSFANDALSHFAERFDPHATRQAAVTADPFIRQSATKRSTTAPLDWPWTGRASDDRGKRVVSRAPRTATRKGKSSVIISW